MYFFFQEFAKSLYTLKINEEGFEDDEDKLRWEIIISFINPITTYYCPNQIFTFFLLSPFAIEIVNI